MNSLPTIIIDSREQTPFSFPADVATERGTLDTGDYSLAGLTNLVAIERKSLPDLCQCIGRERDRFKRELHRLQAYRCRAVIIEADMGAVMAGEYRSKVTPASVLGSVSKWLIRYRVPFLFAGDHGAELCHAILKNFHAHLVETVKAVTGAAGIPWQIQDAPRTIRLDVDPGARETVWSQALADALDGQTVLSSSV